MRKTDRVRGRIFRLVRATAHSRAQVTVEDFPSLTITQAASALNQLARLGELRVVHKGTPRSFGGFDHGIFAPTNSLRAPELTNRQL